MATQKAAAAAVVSITSVLGCIQKRFSGFLCRRISLVSIPPLALEKVGRDIRNRGHPKKLTYLSETIASLQAFRKRHGDAQRLHNQYASQPTTVDFAQYRSILKNKAIVDEAEKLLESFKPAEYDTEAQIKAIEAFEVKAVCIGCRDSSFWPGVDFSWFIGFQGPGNRSQA